MRDVNLGFDYERSGLPAQAAGTWGGGGFGIERTGTAEVGRSAREVTLLPRQWEWLASQSGGASAFLRRLVEEARRSGGSREQRRAAQEAAYRSMMAIAGNLPGYEEGLRALFADDQGKLEQCIAAWPEGIRTYAIRLAFGETNQL